MSATDVNAPKSSPENTAKPRIGPVEAGPQHSARLGDLPGPSFLRVGDIATGGVNDCGETIRCLYYKTRNYAIYATDQRVRIHFSDDADAARKQFAILAPIFPLRHELQYLSKAVREKDGEPCDVGDYRHQIAEAFRIGLESEKSDQAEKVIRAALRDASDRIAREGRLNYLIAAGAFTFLLAAVFFAVAFFAPRVGYFDAGFVTLMRACGSGAIGALLSIAIAIRKRTVAPERDVWTNVADAAVRIVIGVLSGGGVYLLVASGFLGTDMFGGVADGASDGGGMRWQSAVTMGFVAGFLERLVPDLLERGSAENGTTRKTG